MKHGPVPPVAAELVDHIQAVFNAGANQNELIAEMRRVGISLPHSIRLLQKTTGIEFSEAKMAVHSSETWSDMRENNDAFHEIGFAALEAFGFEETSEEAPVSKAS